MNDFRIVLFQDHAESKLVELLDSMDFCVCVYSDAHDILETLKGTADRKCVIVDLQSNPILGLKLQHYAFELNLEAPFVFVIRSGDGAWPESVLRKNALCILEPPFLRKTMQDVLDQAFLSFGAFRAFVESEEHRLRLESLSERERRIVQLAADGIPNKRIATALGLSVKTVEKQRRIAYERLKVNNTAEMARVVTLGNLHPLLRERAKNTLATNAAAQSDRTKPSDRNN